MRKKASQRLGISTGSDKATGAQPTYARKLRKKDAAAANKSKSEEERRLEEQIFGIDYLAADGSSSDVESAPQLDWLSQARRDKLEEGRALADSTDLGMETVADEDLFVLEEPEASTSKILDQPVRSDETPSDDDEDDYKEERRPSYAAPKGKGPARKAALWTDAADDDLSVSLQGTKRLRKLRDQAADDVVTGAEYEQRLRRQFQKIHPVPSWATQGRNGQKSHQLESDDDNEETASTTRDPALYKLHKLLHQSSAGLAAPKLSRRALPSGELEIHRLRDANQVDKDTKSAITALQFHPTAQVLFTTSEDRRLKLYQVDGTVNPLLQAVHTPDLPITAAAFHPSGSSILMTGRRPFFFTYDLQSGRVIRSPRGLWSGGLGGSDALTNDQNGGSLELFSFSPDGRYVAIAGRRGYVHLLDWGVDGRGLMAGGNGGQTIGYVKINTGIQGLSWRNNGTDLVTVGDDASVHTWDIGSRKCIQTWQDDGGFGPTCVKSDPLDRYFAIGSRSGIVNMYDADKAFTTDLPEARARKPAKSVMNLTTTVTSLEYNSTSELLALASRNKKDSMKLLHLPSMSIVSNWPTSGTPLGHVNAVSFSRGSEYIAVGNHRGSVLLYSLPHYNKA